MTAGVPQRQPVSLVGRDIHLSLGHSAVLRGIDVEVAGRQHPGGDRAVRLG